MRAELFFDREHREHRERPENTGLLAFPFKTQEWEHGNTTLFNRVRPTHFVPGQKIAGTEKFSGGRILEGFSRKSHVPRFFEIRRGK